MRFEDVLFSAGKSLDRIEQGFNIAGNIPVLALGSGVLRAAYGSAQIISGLALGVLFSAASGLTGHETGERLRDLASFSFQMIEHGALNIYRGLGAEALAVGVFVIGAIPMLLVNIDSPNGPFKPYISNTEIAEEVISDQDSYNGKWYGPIEREWERVVVELREQLDFF